MSFSTERLSTAWRASVETIEGIANRDPIGAKRQKYAGLCILVGLRLGSLISLATPRFITLLVSGVMQEVAILAAQALAMYSGIAVVPAFWGMHVIAFISFSALAP